MDYSDLNLQLLGTVGDEWLDDAASWWIEEEEGGEEGGQDEDGPDANLELLNWVVSVNGDRIKYNNKLYSKLEYNDETKNLTCYKGDNIDTVYRLRFVQCD